MKIRIKLTHKDWSCAHTGKGKFISRLIPELKELGCEITEALDKDVDIDLQISRRHYKPTRCKKTILRIGPAYLTNKKREKWLNYRKKEGVKHSDGVIYQSKLGKKMCDNFIYKRKRLSTIIFNGSNKTDVKPFSSDYKYNFLASTRIWKKQKRLLAIKRAFVKADMPNSCLWIAGDCGDKPNSDRFGNQQCIKTLGLCDDKRLKKMYKLCDAVIHITFMDCLPNAVCEALAEDCKVICNNTAGTKEIVKPSGGIVLNIDPKWNGKAVNVNKPPKADINLLAQAFHDSLKLPSPKTDHIDIKNIAKQYYDFFKKVLL